MLPNNVTDNYDLRLNIDQIKYIPHSHKSYFFNVHFNIILKLINP